MSLSEYKINSPPYPLNTGILPENVAERVLHKQHHCCCAYYWTSDAIPDIVNHKCLSAKYLDENNSYFLTQYRHHTLRPWLITENDLIAICYECWKNLTMIFTNYSNKSEPTPNQSVIYKGGGTDIKAAPLTTSETVGQAWYNDVFTLAHPVELLDASDNKWIKIVYRESDAYLFCVPDSNELEYLTQPKKQEKQEKQEKPEKAEICKSYATTKESNDIHCCICFDPITTPLALVPCGHTQFCEQCVKTGNWKSCPLCNQHIERYINLYH